MIHRSSFIRFSAVTVTAALTFTACSSGSDESASDDTTEDTEDEDEDDDDEDDDEATEVTDPPAATTETTTTSTTTTTTSTTTTTTVSEEDQQAAFCEATRDFWVTFAGTINLQGEDAVGLERGFMATQLRLEEAADVAPESGSDDPVTQSLAQITRINEALDPVDYDISNSGYEAAFDSVADDLRDLSANAQDAGGFLINECGESRPELEAGALLYVNEVATIPLVGENSFPFPDDESDPSDEANSDDTSAGGFRSVEDDSVKISVFVPSEWTDVDGTPDGDVDRVTASVDNIAFLSGFSERGIILSAQDVPAGTGTENARAQFDATTSTYLESACSDMVEEPYSDIEYTGTIATLQCVDGVDTIVVAGTDAAESRIFWLIMVIDDGDTTTRDNILNTFVVGAAEA